MLLTDAIDTHSNNSKLLTELILLLFVSVDSSIFMNGDSPAWLTTQAGKMILHPW